MLEARSHEIELLHWDRRARRHMDKMWSVFYLLHYFYTLAINKKVPLTKYTLWLQFNLKQTYLRF